MAEQGSWENYSKLVLQQLETLTKSIDVLREELQHMKSQLTELKAKEDFEPLLSRMKDLQFFGDYINPKESLMNILV